MLNKSIKVGYDIDDFRKENGDKELLLLLSTGLTEKVGYYKKDAISELTKAKINSILFEKPVSFNEDDNSGIPDRTTIDEKKSLAAKTFLKYLENNYSYCKDQNGDFYLLYMFAPQLISININNDVFKTLCTDAGINPSTSYFKFTFEEIRCSMQKKFTKITIGMFSVFKEGNLHFQLPDGTIYLINKNEITRIPNGHNSIFFIDHSRNKTKTERIEIKTDLPYLDYTEKLSSGYYFDNKYLTKQDIQILLKSLLIAIVLREYSNVLLPMVLFLGPNRSGKTTLLKNIMSFLFGFIPSNTLLPTIPEDIRSFAACLNNSVFVAFDNIDSAISPHIIDQLANLTTAGVFSTRKLYTTSEEVNTKLSGVIAFTSTNNQLTRQDISQRTLCLKLDRLQNNNMTSNREIDKLLIEMHPHMLSSFMLDLQKTISNLQKIDSENLKIQSSFRMGDFVRIAHASHPNIHNIQETFRNLEKSQSAEAAESKVEIEILHAAYMAHKTDFNHGMTCGELMQKLNGWKYDTKILTAHQKLLTLIRNEESLKKVFHITSTQRGHGPITFYFELQEERASREYYNTLLSVIPSNRQAFRNGLHIKDILQMMSQEANFQQDVVKFVNLDNYILNDLKFNEQYHVASLSEDCYSIVNIKHDTDIDCKALSLLYTDLKPETEGKI